MNCFTRKVKKEKWEICEQMMTSYLPELVILEAVQDYSPDGEKTLMVEWRRSTANSTDLDRCEAGFVWCHKTDQLSPTDTLITSSHRLGDEGRRLRLWNIWKSYFHLLPLYSFIHWCAFGSDQLHRDALFNFIVFSLNHQDEFSVTTVAGWTYWDHW